MIENIKNTIASLIHNCKNIKQLKQIHSHLITSPDLSPITRSFLISRFFFFLCTESSNSSASLHYANKIFNLIPSPSLFIYNALIRVNATKAKDASCSESLHLYKELLRNELRPDCITFPFVLKECSRRIDWMAGRGIHAHVVMFGYEGNVYVQNALINLYSECGVLKDARKVFDDMYNRDVVSWNSIITGCLRCGELDMALGLFREMKERKELITWNTLITGLVRGGKAKEALEMFQEMQILGNNKNMVHPDKITMASVISACASLGAIDHGRWVHCYLEKSGIECDMVIGTALVDMYGKCGHLEKAFEVFKGMTNKDVLTWTAMISVLALHGYGNDAFDVFAEMEKARVGPNAVTFVALLSACAHSGLVEKGQWCFEMMRWVYRIEPQIQHYACMIDILGRAGLFNEAEELIISMPMKPDVFVWGALLGGCQMHGNVKLGEEVSRQLINLEPENHAFYMNLCDFYAKACRFDDLKELRCLMKDLEIRKLVPGCSMIEVDGNVYEFTVRGSDEMLTEALNSVLMLLSNEMKLERDMVCLIR